MLSCEERKCAGLLCEWKECPLLPSGNVVHPFLFFFCMFQCCALYHRCVIHALFLQSYLLLCNWLFSRHQTFLSKDTNVCSVVMDMLGSQMRRVAHCCRCGCSFFLFISDTVDFFLLIFIFLVLDKITRKSCSACLLYLWAGCLGDAFLLSWICLLIFLLSFFSSVVKEWRYWQGYVTVPLPAMVYELVNLRSSYKSLLHSTN